MPVCPECEEFIDSLELCYEERGYSTYSYNYSERALWREEGPVGERETNYWRCPRCHRKLFNLPEEARDFLNVPELEKRIEKIERGKWI